VWDLTQAEMEGRTQVAQLANFFRKYVPGFEKAYPERSGIMTCVRESRRIMGEYKLTADDVLNVHTFSDAIALGATQLTFTTPWGKEQFLKK
jgi:hypothetical protein